MSVDNIDLKRVEYLTTDRGVTPVYADQIVQQPDAYKEEDHHIWSTLLQRQTVYVQDKASSLFLNALSDMSFPLDRIPRFDDINQVLRKTGWKLVAVNGLLSDVLFFELLGQRLFPVTWWIRKKSQLDYIQEPDLFHDLFGHVPLLSNPTYADAMQRFGAIGSGAKHDNPMFMEGLARLYWYTVEFGLMNEKSKLKAFGAGLMSSRGEAEHALSNDPQHKPFKMHTAIRTAYKIDAYQPVYFVMNDFSHIIKELDLFEKLYLKA